MWTLQYFTHHDHLVERLSQQLAWFTLLQISDIFTSWGISDYNMAHQVFYIIWGELNPMKGYVCVPLRDDLGRGEVGILDHSEFKLKWYFIAIKLVFNYLELVHMTWQKKL